MSGKPSRREFINAAGFAATGLLAASQPLAAAPLAPQSAPPGTSMASRYRAMLRGTELAQTIAVHDVLSARLVEADGFQSVFVGSSNIAANGHGLLDAGLISLTELIEFAERITSNIDIPAIADTDDGGPTAVHSYRAAKRLERAGVAGIMMEDMLQTNRFGAPTDVVPKDQMVQKIKAVRDASGLVIVARCDALSAKHSMEDVLDRTAAYAEAGADVFFISGIRPEDVRRTTDLLKKPLMTTVAADMPLAKVKESGFGVALYTTLLQSIAMGAVHNALVELKTSGMMPNAAKISLPRDVAARLTRTQEIGDRAKQYHVIP